MVSNSEFYLDINFCFYLHVQETKIIHVYDMIKLQKKKK